MFTRALPIRLPADYSNARQFYCQCGNWLTLTNSCFSGLVNKDGLLEKCSEIMVENINADTVCRYYTAAVQYGQLSVVNKCVQWLERRLTSTTTVKLLKEIR